MRLRQRLVGWAEQRGGRVGQLASVGGRVSARFRADRGALVAAGLAFYGTLSVIPAAIAVATVYALTTDVSRVTRQLQSLLDQAPREIENLAVDQVITIANRAESNLWLWAVAGFVIWAWSASRGTAALLRALNLAHGLDHDRGAPRRRLLAVGVTVIALALVAAGFGIGLTALRTLDLGGWPATLVRWGRWPVLLAVAAGALAVAYRYGPDRRESGLRVLYGSGLAAALWLLASAGLVAYLAAFGLNSAVYGIFGTVLAVQLWLFAGAYAILLGAYVNAEMSDGESGARPGPADHPRG